MARNELHVVTGAFSFTGRYITRRLLDRGDRVRTLTNHPDREHPFGEAVPAEPLDFDSPSALRSALEGASTLFNTYWIRFERGDETFERAVGNIETLLRAAREAGVSRIVHFSIVNADENAPLPYFRAKAEAERVVRDSGISHAILRPTVLFGKGAILFNNIAWMLRRFPVFAMAGRGDYRLQPVSVEDVADHAVALALADEPASTVRDVAGPETFAFVELVKLIARRTGSRSRMLKVKPDRMLRIINTVSGMVEDPVITREELEGLTREMLVSGAEPAGESRFTDWIEAYGDCLGQRYFSAIERHFH